MDVTKPPGVDTVHHVCSEKKEVGVKGHCPTFPNESPIRSEAARRRPNKNMAPPYEVEPKVSGNRKTSPNIGPLFVRDELLPI